MNISTGLDIKGAIEGALGTKQGTAQFELRVGPFISGELTVVSFEGREALNEPFIYDVVFSSSLDEDLLQLGIFGFPACLSIHAPDPHEPRVIQGIAVGFEAIGAADSEIGSKVRRFMTRIVPRLWLAKHQRRSRVFQKMTVVEIAQAVLTANGIKPDVQLGKDDYPKIPFEYQRDETDLEFLDRVLATAGVFYYFRHASGLLDQLIPGAGAIAGDVGAAAGAVGSAFGGATAGAAGFVSDGESTLGLTTTLVLTDKADSTEQLGDTSLDAANLAKAPLTSALGGLQSDATSAATSAFGSAAGSVVGSVAGAVGLSLGSSDKLVFDGNGQAGPTDTERVYAFRMMKEVRARQVDLRSWDIRDARAFSATSTSSLVSAGATVNLAASLDLTGKLSLGAGAGIDFAADALPIAPSQATMFEYQQDLGLLGVADKKGPDMAKRALLQERSDWMTAAGETDCRRLAPGYRFTLTSHPIDRLNAEYLVTEMRSRAFSPDQVLQQPEAHDFRNVFRCVPGKVDPKPRKPAAAAHPPEPAIVVGPTWGDINCDPLGRILVRFRWARAGGSSEGDEGVCWVHWLERWGGDGYGTQTIPRVGSEVLVDFHGGGEPIAIGQIHSQANMPPFSLPAEATKVGVRSRVVPNGADSEISIDDNPNSEKVLIRASGDYETRVTRDTTTVLSGTYDLTVSGDRRETTESDTTLTFDQDLSVGVAGTLREEVGADRIEIVLGSVDEFVDGDVSRSVSGNTDVLVQGEHKQTYGADSLARHQGHHTVIVAPLKAGGQASAALHVEGAVRAYAKNKIEAISLEGLTILCGQTEITIATDSITISSPTITLTGKTVQLTASDTAAITGKTTTVTGTDSTTVTGANKATVQGKSANVVIDSDFTVGASSIKLGSQGSSSSQSQQTKQAKITTITLNDTDGNPMANQRVILRKGGDGGQERSVVLDAAGSIDIEGDDSFDVVFPDEPDAKS